VFHSVAPGKKEMLHEITPAVEAGTSWNDDHVLGVSDQKARRLTSYDDLRIADREFVSYPRSAIASHLDHSGFTLC
jgi:hypothetical protein